MTCEGGHWSPYWQVLERCGRCAHPAAPRPTPYLPMLLGLPTLVGEILVGVALGPWPQHVDHAVLLGGGTTYQHAPPCPLRVCVPRAPHNSSAAPCACACVSCSLVARARLALGGTAERVQAGLWPCGDCCSNCAAQRPKEMSCQRRTPVDGAIYFL